VRRQKEDPTTIGERPGDGTSPREWQRWRSPALAIGCLGLLVFLLIWSHQRPVPAAHTTARPLRPPRSASEAVLDDASRWYLLAQMGVYQRMEALEAWDQSAIDPRTPEVYRRQFIAGTVEIRHAREAACQAVALARSRHETCRALEFLARIECDLGHHQEELRRAETVVRVGPHDPRSWWVLRHAAHCTGRTELERRADAALRGYPPMSTAESEHPGSDGPIPPCGR
jgi:hypothetical protein